MEMKLTNKKLKLQKIENKAHPNGCFQYQFSLLLLAGFIGGFSDFFYVNHQIYITDSYLGILDVFELIKKQKQDNVLR